MVETLAESFEITFKQLQKEREAEDVSRVGSLPLPKLHENLLSWFVFLFIYSIEEGNSWLSVVSQ